MPIKDTFAYDKNGRRILPGHLGNLVVAKILEEQCRRVPEEPRNHPDEPKGNTVVTSADPPNTHGN